MSVSVEFAGEGDTPSIGRIARRFAQCIVLLLLAGCASQSLEVWHTVRITEEFRAGMLRDLDTFERRGDTLLLTTRDGEVELRMRRLD